jgi:hypothetical protein
MTEEVFLHGLPLEFLNRMANHVSLRALSIESLAMLWYCQGHDGEEAG